MVLAVKTIVTVIDFLFTFVTLLNQMRGDKDIPFLFANSIMAILLMVNTILMWIQC